MALTKKKIDSFKYDGRTMDFRPDGSDGIPNFGVRLYKSGIKSFVLGYRLPGTRKQQWITIGKYGVITLKQAQERAQELLWDISRGIDPKAQSTDAQTLAEFSVVFLEEHRIRGTRTVDEMERRIRKHLLPAFGKKDLAAITRVDASKLLNLMRSQTRLKSAR